ncbi:MAG: hypothetical protein U1A77_23170 [Pirellulales bacterium]
MGVALGDDGDFHLNDWSFGQFCKLAGVGKETVNRLSPDTASRVTFVCSDKAFLSFSASEGVTTIDLSVA